MSRDPRWYLSRLHAMSVAEAAYRGYRAARYPEPFYFDRALVLEALILVAHLLRARGIPSAELEAVIHRMADYLGAVRCGDGSHADQPLAAAAALGARRRPRGTNQSVTSAPTVELSADLSRRALIMAIAPADVPREASLERLASFAAARGVPFSPRELAAS